MFGILVFFVGCLVNATTPQMMGLIAGRTVQGLGGGCVMTMSYVIVADLAPLKWRPRFQSGLTVVYGLASVVGTLIGKIPHITIRRMCQLNLNLVHIGGVFVDQLTWRWVNIDLIVKFEAICLTSRIIGFLVECNSCWYILHYCHSSSQRAYQSR